MTDIELVELAARRVALSLPPSLAQVKFLAFADELLKLQRERMKAELKEEAQDK